MAGSPGSGSRDDSGAAFPLTEKNPDGTHYVAPTHAMILAGARSIGNTAHEQNHMQRALDCWRAMNAARDGVDELKPSSGSSK